MEYSRLRVGRGSTKQDVELVCDRLLKNEVSYLCIQNGTPASVYDPILPLISSCTSLTELNLWVDGHRSGLKSVYKNVCSAETLKLLVLSSVASLANLLAAVQINNAVEQLTIYTFRSTAHDDWRAVREHLRDKTSLRDLSITAPTDQSRSYEDLYFTCSDLPALRCLKWATSLPRGARFRAEMLASLPLITLDLSGHSMRDKDAYRCLRQLACNTSLRVLKLPRLSVDFYMLDSVSDIETILRQNTTVSLITCVNARSKQVDCFSAVTVRNASHFLYDTRSLFDIARAALYKRRTAGVVHFIE